FLEKDVRRCNRLEPVPDPAKRHCCFRSPADRKNKKGGDRRAGGCRSAERVKDGRVAPPPPLPCRSGKRREKIFPEPAPNRKVHSDQGLARDSSVESKTWQGSGREARKPADCRSASRDHCHH